MGTRRDAFECLDFAARGVVKVHHREEKMEKLGEVSGSFSSFFFSYFAFGACVLLMMDMLMVVVFFQVFQEMKDGKLIGRVVIDLQ